MRGNTLGELIEKRLGSQIKSDYDRLKKKNDLEVMKHGIKIGMNIARSITGEEVTEGYVEHVYNAFLSKRG